MVLFNAPNGFESCGTFSLPLSSSWPSDVAPNVLSRKSVLRLKSEGGGEATVDSSLESLFPAMGELRLDCKRSVESRRRFPGREEGEFAV